MTITTGVPIRIHLETQIKQADDIENHIFDEPGQLIQMGDVLYIRYKELDESTQTRIPVMMKLESNGDIQLTRGSTSTDVQLRLRFSQGNKVLTRYRTAYGIIPVMTVTPNMQIKLQTAPLAGEIRVQYQLYAQDQLLGDYNLTLLFNA